MIGEWLNAAESDEKLRYVCQQEELIVQVTELVAVAMEKAGVTKADLAKRLGKSPAFVTQLLAGNANMTLRTIADIFTALGLELNVSYRVSMISTRSRKEKSAGTAASSTVVSKSPPGKRVVRRK